MLEWADGADDISVAFTPAEDEAEHGPFWSQCRDYLGGTIEIVVHEDYVGRAIGLERGQQSGNRGATHDHKDVVINVVGR